MTEIADLDNHGQNMELERTRGRAPEATFYRIFDSLGFPIWHTQFEMLGSKKRSVGSKRGLEGSDVVFSERPGRVISAQVDCRNDQYSLYENIYVKDCKLECHEPVESMVSPASPPDLESKPNSSISSNIFSSEDEPRDLFGVCCVDDFLSDEISRCRSVCEFLSTVDCTQTAILPEMISVLTVIEDEPAAKRRLVDLTPVEAVGADSVLKTQPESLQPPSENTQSSASAAPSNPAIQDLSPAQGQQPNFPTSSMPSSASAASATLEESEEAREQRRREQNREAQRRFRERRKYREFQAFSYRLAASAAGAAGAAPLLARLAAGFRC